MKILGKSLQKNQVSIAANTSSQFISALMLVAPLLPKGLTLQLEGAVTSVPYINMTLALLKELRIEGRFSKNQIQILYKKSIAPQTVTVESDWSSASYFYSIVALSEGLKLTLKSYKKNSLQGDAALSEIYAELGVKTTFWETENAITLSKTTKALPHKGVWNLVNTPDIAQTIAVTCFGLGIDCELTGLHTLKIKETDRLEALKTELEKFGAQITVDHQSLQLMASDVIRENVTLNTYNDHRMAMAFAPLALKTSLTIDDCMVVTKSFPTFWEDLSHLGISVTLQ